MSGYLLDTSVLSTLAPGRHSPSALVEAWFHTHSDVLYLSVITLAEIERGIRKLQRSGAAARASDLARWLQDTIRAFGGNILSIDAALARAIGVLSDAAFARGRHPGFEDVAIAATAQTRALTLLTRNVRHFQPLGVQLADPFERLP